MTVVEAAEAQRVAEDVADLVELANERQDDPRVVAVVEKVLDRHEREERSAVRLALAAQMLNVSRSTLELWVERRLLEQVPGRPKKVSAVSLGRVLALVRRLRETAHGRERLLRALEHLRDQDLLARARKATEESSPEAYLVYDEAALAELRSG